MRRVTRQYGISLLELLIAMALAMVALAGLVSLVGFGVGMNANMVTSSTLNEESYAVMQLMQRDIRRAGYSGDTVDMVTDPVANPSPFVDSIETGAYPDEAPNSCILFSYDANNNGLLDVPGELFGFRLRAGGLEMRQDGLICADDGWAQVTDDTRSVLRALEFDVDQEIENDIPVTVVTLSMLSESVANDTISRRYVRTFMVENHDG